MHLFYYVLVLGSILGAPLFAPPHPSPPPLPPGLPSSASGSVPAVCLVFEPHGLGWFKLRPHLPASHCCSHGRPCLSGPSCPPPRSPARRRPVRPSRSPRPCSRFFKSSAHRCSPHGRPTRLICSCFAPGRSMAAPSSLFPDPAPLVFPARSLCYCSRFFYLFAYRLSPNSRPSGLTCSLSLLDAHLPALPARLA